MSATVLSQLKGYCLQCVRSARSLGQNQIYISVANVY